ncbi:TIGR03085 family protein [Rhodococcus triatomae]|uniref:TIGR03085 family protein n=1 Tax=Rhodococcus triatomae TaxID=300028 RepID=A0A1G8MZ94_9NOCA|nr:TIGR03085 family metal-binding protein [Rhodococcus triatomae]QNG19134.1 TIGR03085 family protein [Rhodococcus triatomae]QNG24954.1 TIGR03085 family protein [Rhodococcus triatomae]SDI73234.1 TIGR03085 family protein [Rhodococcus triatomae]
MTFARDERRALVATMVETGPDAPTLCGQWTTRDLAAHLIARERRLDSAPGILVPALAGHTERVRAGIARRPWTTLLDQVRSGPPVWSPLRWVDALANTAEMFVHHEDVRRAEGRAWTPRELGDDRQDALWKLVSGMGRRAYRKAPVTVVLERPDGRRVVARTAGESVVTVRGEPAEQLLYAFGRDQVRLDLDGEPDDVAAVTALDRSL